MATTAAENLKKKFAEMPDECFEPLLFSELKNGQKFIWMPTPGDNSGHGGFRKAHWLFQKKDETTAVNIIHNTESNMTPQMHVILVE